MPVVQSSIVLFTRNYSTRIFPFLSTAIGSLPAIETDLQMTKQELLEVLLDIFKTITQASHLALFMSADGAVFNVDCFIGTVDYLANVYT